MADWCCSLLLKTPHKETHNWDRCFFVHQDSALTDKEIEAELANYRTELLAEKEATLASEDGNAKKA